MSEITLLLAATSAEHAPKKQSVEHAPKSSLQNMPQNAVEKIVLQNVEEKKLVSKIFTFGQPYRVTSGQTIHSQLLYTRAKQ